MLPSWQDELSMTQNYSNSSTDSSPSLSVPSPWHLSLHSATTSLSCDLMPRKFISSTGDSRVVQHWCSCNSGLDFYDLFFSSTELRQTSMMRSHSRFISSSSSTTTPPSSISPSSRDSSWGRPTITQGQCRAEMFVLRIYF